MVLVNMISDIEYSDQTENSANSSNMVQFKCDSSIQEMKTRVEEISGDTPLQKFYNQQTIFITGGTGFLGKILIHKLLQCCPQISCIYVLIREKKGKSIHERIIDLLADSIFTEIKKQMSQLDEKVIGISGDISVPRLGLSDPDVAMLADKVSIVFHVAATVRFDEKLKQAAATNLCSTATMLELCKKMKNLKSFVHVSTMYANCFVNKVEEKFYDYDVNNEEILSLINKLSEDTLNTLTPQLLSHWPNTYTFTKALTEDHIRTQNKGLPMGIFRPEIVISSAFEPAPGWVDNFNGPTAVMAGVASGIMRTFPCDEKNIANIVPVDLCVNAMIACAWDIATQTARRDDKMLIYNFTSTQESPISWGDYVYITTDLINKYPSNTAHWYGILILSKFSFIFTLYSFFLHWIPAYLLDFGALIIGHKPRLQKTYERVDKLTKAIKHFCLNEWDVKNTNIQDLWSRLDSRDQQMFRFTMQDFDWQTYLANYVKGIRVYLLKDDLSTLEKGKIKRDRFYRIHNSILIAGTFLVLWFFYNIVMMIL